MKDLTSIKIILVYLISNLIYSCNSEPNCELEKELFQSTWKEKVKKYTKLNIKNQHLQLKQCLVNIFT